MEPLESRRLLSASPEFVADINLFGGGSMSSEDEFVRAGAITYFTATATDSGRQIWKTDGTEQGTVRVTGAEFAQSPSDILNLTVVGDTLFFVARAPSSGWALWKSDGTGAGTALVRSIVPGNYDPRPDELTNVNGTLFFVADDGQSGRELWTSDGSTIGTIVVKDIQAGSEGSRPENLNNVDGQLFFSAFESTHGRELWRSDGTTGGTSLVIDLRPGTSGAFDEPSPIDAELNATLFANIGTTLYFVANDGTHGWELWKTDGTAPGTLLVKDIRPGADGSFEGEGILDTLITPGRGYLTAVDDTLFFMARNSSTNFGLWATDGTQQGTLFLQKLNTELVDGFSPSSPYFINVNGTLYFSARSSLPTTPIQLWRSDGTVEGTLPVFESQSLPNQPRNLTNVAGSLFFTAVGGGNGVTSHQLWKSDGTESGTSLVSTLNVHSVPNGPFGLTNANGILLFAADGGLNGSQPWTSDGADTGTDVLRVIPNGSLSSDVDPLGQLGDTLIFFADDSEHGVELWRSDGTTSGTSLIKDIQPGPPSSSTGTLKGVTIGNVLYFSANDGENGYELWKTDGSPEGTVLVKDISTGIAPSSPRDLIEIDGVLYFSAEDGVAGRELWKSDGTEQGTVLVSDIRPGMNGSSPLWLTNVNGVLFFQANSGSIGAELWRSNGTAGGTSLVHEIYPGIGGSHPIELSNLNGTLVFAASHPSNGTEPWRSDGTAAGTTLIKDLFRFGSSLPSIVESTVVRDYWVFAANDGEHGIELWKTDGTEAGTELIKDIRPGSASSSPVNLANIGGILYFTANDGVLGSELWKSDLTNEGTVLVKDLTTGPTGRSPGNFTALGDLVYFSNRFGLWRTDGTSENTSLVLEGLASDPGLVVVGNNLFFSAQHDADGEELWKIELLAVDAGGPYFADEGQTITLDASGSSPEATLFEWDLDGNGSFETVGQSVSYFAEDSGVHTVTLRITGPSGTAFDTAPIEVANLPPIARVNGVLAGFTDLSSHLRLWADDPSPVDQAAGFDFEIDYDGDGTVDDVVSGPTGTLVSHVFSTSGVHHVQVTAIDKDGGRSELAEHRIVIIDAARVPDASQPGLTNLVWTGTNGDDHVVFTQSAPTTILIEIHQLDGVPLSPSFRAYMFGIDGQVIADGLAGNDLIDLNGVNTISAQIFGGLGQDTIFGSQADDLIYSDDPQNTSADGAEGDGGEGRPGDHVYAGGGDDLIYGSTARDYLGGGTGHNRFQTGRDGAEGRDTLVGSTADDNTTPLLTSPATDAVVNDLDTLDAALADWDQAPSDRWLLEVD